MEDRRPSCRECQRRGSKITRDMCDTCWEQAECPFCKSVGIDTVSWWPHLRCVECLRMIPPGSYSWERKWR